MQQLLFYTLSTTTALRGGRGCAQRSYGSTPAPDILQLCSWFGPFYRCCWKNKSLKQPPGRETVHTPKSTSALPLAFVIPRLLSGVSSPGSSFPGAHASGPNPKVTHECEAQQFLFPAGGVSVRGAGGGGSEGKLRGFNGVHFPASPRVLPLHSRRGAGSASTARTQCLGALQLLIYCFLPPRDPKAILGKEGRAGNASGSLCATAPQKKAP